MPGWVGLDGRRGGDLWFLSVDEGAHTGTYGVVRGGGIDGYERHCGKDLAWLDDG